MPGIAPSITKKKQKARAEQEKAYAEAIEVYHEEQKKPEDQRKSRRAICREIIHKWKARRKPINISPDTLRRQLEGGQTCAQFNAEQKMSLMVGVRTFDLTYDLSI
jgi:hypothetical protein